MHHKMLEAANLITVVGGNTTAHEVQQRARCHKCGVKGNNTYQIVYTGNSDVAMDGAGVMYVYYADGTKRYDCIFTRVD